MDGMTKAQQATRSKPVGKQAAFLRGSALAPVLGCCTGAKAQ